MSRQSHNPNNQSFLRTFSDEESSFDNALRGDAALRYTSVMIDCAKDALANPNPFGMDEATAQLVIKDGQEMTARRRAYLEPIWRQADGDEQKFPLLVEVADTATYMDNASPGSQAVFWGLHEQAVQRLSEYQHVNREP